MEVVGLEISESVSYNVTLCIWWYAYSCLCNRSTNPMHQPFL